MRRARLIAAAGIVGALALAAFVFLQAGYALLVSRHLDGPDAIVVLASHEWERLPVAAQLGRKYPAAKVLLTLPEVVTEHNCHECPERLNRLSEAGIDRDRVVVLPNLVTNTYDEARAATAFAARHGIDRLVIVTSPYHGRRALATFQHMFEAAGVSAHLGLASSSSSIEPARWWQRRYDREYVAYEWAGLIYYAIRFGVPPTV